MESTRPVPYAGSRHRNSSGRGVFSESEQARDLVATLDDWQKAGDKRLFKFIISPEFGDRVNLERLTRELMTRMERDLATRLEWMVVSHFNTGHPHVHVALRGRRADGSALLQDRLLRRRKMQISAMTLFILTTLAVQASPLGVSAERPRPDRSIVKTADAYLKAVLAGDTAALGATYRDDAVEMPPGRPPLKGRAAIEQYYREFFQGPVKITAFTFSHLEAASAGEVGYTAGTYEQKLLGGPAGPIDDTGKFVVIVKRTGSAWKAAYVIYNSDHPPANSGAAALPLPFPQRDLAALFSHYADLAYGWLVHFALLALGVASLALIVLLVRVIRWRSADLVTPKSRRPERLRSAQRNYASAIHRTAGASLHP